MTGGYFMFMVFIPLLPGAALSPNGAHGAWGPVSAARKELREATYYAVQERRDRPPPLTRARVGITLYRAKMRLYNSRYRPTDVPNMVSACKPVYDGLVDAGVLPDDDAAHMRLGEHAIEAVETAAEEGLRVTVEAW